MHSAIRLLSIVEAAIGALAVVVQPTIRLLSVVEAAIRALADRNAAPSPIVKNSASSPPLLATVEPRLPSAQASIESRNPGKARIDRTIKTRNHDPSPG